MKRSLQYDPITGQFTWSNGDKLKTSTCLGYLRINLGNEMCYLHRLAYLFMAKTPPNIIDHVNGDRSDNRWCNLREATRSQNMCNAKVSAKSKSGVKGITWCQRQGYWKTGLTLDGKYHHLGSFVNLEEAKTIMFEARKKLHKEFAKL